MSWQMVLVLQKKKTHSLVAKFYHFIDNKWNDKFPLAHTEGNSFSF